MAGDRREGGQPLHSKLIDQVRSWISVAKVSLRREGRPESPAFVHASASVAEQARIIRAANLFERQWYLNKNPDVAASTLDPLLHYLEFGWREGRDPGRVFSTNYYLDANPDVRGTGINPLYHYAIVGRFQGRKPHPDLGASDIDSERHLVAQEFDREFYIREYPEVSRTGQEPIEHFLLTGWREGKDPNPRFSVRDYLRANPDVRAAAVNPFLHYLAEGRREGRLPRADLNLPDSLLLEWRTIAPEFDDAFYRANNPDVVQAGVEPILHFLTNGWKEGRDPSPDFSVRFYLDAHADVRAANINPLTHYVSEGRREGRAHRQSGAWHSTKEISSAIANDFDHNYYLALNPDVASARVDPLQHFVEFGWKEGRDPSPTFSTSFYLEANSDVANARVNPFYHYLVAGKSEGRLPAHPGGWKARALQEQLPLSHQVEALIADVEREVQVGDRLQLASALTSAIVGRRAVIISLTQDDYTKSVGGVQLCAKIENEKADRSNTAYVNLHPCQALPTLFPGPDFPKLNVLADGNRVGSYDGDVVVQALQELAATASSIHIVVHSLLGHSPEFVTNLCRVLSPHTVIYWVHDFFSLCPSYTLLRNGITYCAAPKLTSTGCSICSFGEERLAHVERFRNLFDTVSVDVIAPSQFAAEFWRSHTTLRYRQLFVSPHCTIDADRNASIERSRDRPTRVAFLGHPAAHKGWNVFVDVVERYGRDDRYEFHHFGAGIKSLKSVTFTRVSVAEDGPTAMLDALKAAEIDVVLLWSIWPETFSFVAHEAFAAGCSVITSKDAGNITSLVRDTRNGNIVNDERELLRRFGDGSVRELALKRCGQPGLLRFGNMSVDLLLGREEAEG
jgi:hypothetical protein